MDFLNHGNIGKSVCVTGVERDSDEDNDEIGYLMQLTMKSRSFLAIFARERDLVQWVASI